MKDIKVTFGVDVDAVAGWLGSYGGEDSLQDIQRGLFAGDVGLPAAGPAVRPLRHSSSTFFTPGHSIETFPRSIEMLERDVLERSLELIESVWGRKPTGYIAPWGEMTTITADILLEAGIEYDRTQVLHDFQPFYARTGDSWTKIDYSRPAHEWMKPLVRGTGDPAGVAREFNWYLDDLPPMMFVKTSPNSDGFKNPRDIEELWRDQFDWVYREYDYATFPIMPAPRRVGASAGAADRASDRVHGRQARSELRHLREHRARLQGAPPFETDAQVPLRPGVLGIVSEAAKPARVVVFSLGGTIAAPAASSGAQIELDADAVVGDLARAVGVEVTAVTFRRLPSASLSLIDVADFAAAVGEALREGHTAAVVAVGTDTLEDGRVRARPAPLRRRADRRDRRDAQRGDAGGRWARESRGGSARGRVAAGTRTRGSGGERRRGAPGALGAQGALQQARRVRE
ncbi:hypothetical protein LUZ63_023709 [Rhynchospora breviuscula]|uniref:L-asparaginase N-terminal domain-containing protein n=1 Tax=Rhynchospora breviuscula TaxID=2022672 RepID=A0A9P9Z2D2_9POAL|nr:hypothetical protein LUZ63_023709 [Rhynchospora breviuscula]